MPLFKRLAGLVFFSLLIAGAVRGEAETFTLDYDRLSGAIEDLNGADRNIVSDAIKLIQRGEHVLALNRLSSLKERNPGNSSVRVLASYALLQAGNLLGAFDEAKRAHEGPKGNSYVCWFLAKVALLNGQRAVCERELEHLRKDSNMRAEAEQLERELTAKYKD